MKVKNKRARVTAAAVTLLSVLAAAGLWLMYRMTRYLPLFTASVTLLLPALINLLFCLWAGEKEDALPGRETEGEKNFLRRAAALTVAALRAAGGFLRQHFAVSVSAAALLIFAGIQVWEAVMLRRLTSLYTVSYFHAVLLIVLFVLFIIFEKICRHAEEDLRENGPDDPYARALLGSIRSGLAAGRLVILLILPCLIIRLLGFFELQKYLSVAAACVFYYVSAVLLLTFVTRLIRRELPVSPDLRIPVPFSGGADLGFISYLEENTGITMRRLWSLKLMRSLLPYALLAVILLLWGATGIVQIEADQEGALYRFGRLCEEPLEPGLHFVLPYPMDRVSIYDTQKVKKITIGYKSEENTDNLWTASHGTGEFRLLLGGGKEVVSINLRIEYRIGDLMAYLRGSAEPERLLEAYAYELITRRTISTDLDTLLSADREEFAAEFAADLKKTAAEQGTGLEIVSVVLESIHPPIEIADVYQNLIGAEVLAEKLILEAQGVAAMRLAAAQSQRDSAVGEASAEGTRRIAAAGSEVAQFEAAAAAHSAYPDAYAYHKYLNAITAAYGGAKLILVGDGVDSSRIYLGSLNGAAAAK